MRTRTTTDNRQGLARIAEELGRLQQAAEDIGEPFLAYAIGLALVELARVEAERSGGGEQPDGRAGTDRQSALARHLTLSADA